MVYMLHWLLPLPNHLASFPSAVRISRSASSLWLPTTLGRVSIESSFVHFVLTVLLAGVDAALLRDGAPTNTWSGGLLCVPPSILNMRTILFSCL